MTGLFPTSTSAAQPAAASTRMRTKRRPGEPGRPRSSAVAGMLPDLRRVLEAHVAASPLVSSTSPDPICEALWRAACFQDGRIAAVRARLPSKTVTLVAVPSDLWIDGARRGRVLALKRTAVRSGRRVILVPEGALRREPRLGNAVLMAQAARTAIGAEDRIAVMAALAEEPGMALGDLIQVVRHAPDRVAAVLSLARSGVVDVDRRRPIGPLTPVWLRAGQL